MQIAEEEKKKKIIQSWVCTIISKVTGQFDFQICAEISGTAEKITSLKGTGPCLANRGSVVLGQTVQRNLTHDL